MIAGIPEHMLIAAGPLGRVRAQDALRAMAAGVREGGAPEPELWPLPRSPRGEQRALREILDERGFDGRMRAARALVVCADVLSPATLAASPAFELATRARQAGVPAFAVAGASTLSSFEVRILDLQAVLVARGEPALRAAGRELAALV